MGVKLGDIVPRTPAEVSDFSGWVMAMDAFNTLYQFISTIRQPDGTPLMDDRGRITSHLSGLLYRTSSLIESGIKPVFVFDGTSPDEKEGTVESRRHIRETAEKEWQEAIDEGDMERAARKARQSSRLTSEIIEESKDLLRLMGIPVVQAPSEGEAQAAYMAGKEDVKAAVSQDLDSLLFGAPLLVRNLAVSGRRKVARRDIYITVTPEIIELEAVLEVNGITREQLVDMAILVGTDFNKGVRGIGAKTGLKLIKKHGNLEEVMKAKGIEIPNYRRLREIFLDPPISDDYEIVWAEVDIDGIKDLLCREHDFSEKRVDSAIKRLDRHFQATKQRSLDNWF